MEERERKTRTSLSLSLTRSEKCSFLYTWSESRRLSITEMKLCNFLDWYNALCSLHRIQTNWFFWRDSRMCKKLFHPNEDDQNLLEFHKFYNSSICAWQCLRAFTLFLMRMKIIVRIFFHAQGFPFTFFMALNCYFHFY